MSGKYQVWDKAYFRSRLTVKFPPNEIEHHSYMKFNLLKDPLSDTFAGSSASFNVCTKYFLQKTLPQLPKSKNALNWRHNRLRSNITN